MSFGGGSSDNGSAQAREDRLAAAEARAAEAETLRLENERADKLALSEKKSLADKELLRKKKQAELTRLGGDNEDEPTALLG